MTGRMPGPTSHTFFSQRLRLHYVDWGNSTKPPMVMLHGGRDHCRNWDWAAEALRDDWHILAPDLRGHGDSAWSSDGSYTIAGYIYDLAQLVHQQHLAPVTIIAHSLGGQIASALRRPLSRHRRPARGHRRPRALARPARRSSRRRRSSSAWTSGSASSAVSPAGCHDATTRSRTPFTACRKRTRASPPSRPVI